MNNTITVWHNGISMLVYKEVAQIIGIKNGHRIESESELWAILEANASHGIDRCTQLEDARTNNN